MNFRQWKRREFITLVGGATTAWSLAARARHGDRIRRIGALVGLPANDPEVRAWLAAFEHTLGRLGWSLGRNISIDYRYAPAGTRVQELAKEVVAAQPDC